MDVEQYLASEQAAEDVAEHLARPSDDHKITTCGWYGRDDTWSSRPVAKDHRPAWYIVAPLLWPIWFPVSAVRTLLRRSE